MGKGDKKTRRGKIIIGSYGVRRMRKKTQALVVNVVEKQKPEVEEKQEPVVVKKTAKVKTTKAAPAKKKKEE